MAIFFSTMLAKYHPIGRSQTRIFQILRIVFREFVGLDPPLENH